MITDITNAAEEVNPAFWATESNKIALQKGFYTFKGREYLVEPMSSTMQRLAMMKGTQGGASITVMLLCLWGMIFKHYERGVLYLFPTATDVREFSQAVLNPLLASNRHALGRFVKSAKGGSDTTTLKQVNGANFFMRGAGLKQIVDGQVGEATALKGISCDMNVYDEVELMDPDALAKARGRLGASDVAREIFIGNPGIPGYGIDKIFQESDQRYWFRKCLHCGTWTCAEESFPDCVKIRKDGTGYIGCMKCGKEVFVRDGKWVPKYKENSDHMHGYRWSQLTSPPKDPGLILADFLNPPENNLADVYRIQLGLPYVNAEERLTTGQVYSRCGPFVMGNSDPGPCSFGLDVGKTCHLVIGKRIGKKQFEIVKVARLPGDGDWSEISKMIMRFNCKSGVIDIRPYEATARQFQKAHAMRIFLCQYDENSTSDKSFNIKTGIVKVNRTEICDATHNLVAEDGLLTLPRKDTPEIREFAKQVCNPAKSLETNKRTRQSVYRYLGTEDHYRHALNYFLLAAEKSARADTRHKTSHQYDTVDNEYAII